MPATTANLGPGFDSFGAAVDLHLVAASCPRGDQPARVSTTGEGQDEVADDDGNLIWRSLVAFCDRFDLDVPDVAIRVRNDIPLERGLGSSSAAIVAGIELARALTATSVGVRDLAEVATALEGHPDNVVPAIVGGLTASAYDDAGGLTIRRVMPHPRLRPVALVPETRQQTTAARAVVPEALERAAVADQAARAGHVLAGLAGLWPVEPALAGDRLHEPARLAAMSATGALVAALRERGLHAWLSGAGPAAAAAVPADDRAALDACTTTAAEHGFGVLALDWDLSGAIACATDGGPGCAWAAGATCVQCPAQRV